MSVGFQVAVAAVPFLDLLDQEEDSLARQVAEAGDAANATATKAAMDATRRRLAQGIDSIVRSLPAVVRRDLTASRSVAYALAGLVDGRMIHHPAGGLEGWRERLLEFDLYGSALAGQEVVARAQAAAQGAFEESGPINDAALAPFYLAVFRAGFEGSLRADPVGLSSLVASLEEAVGARREQPLTVAPDVRPKRFGLSPVPLAALGLVVWLAAGFAVWITLSDDALEDAARMAARVSAGLPATGMADPLDRSIGPSGLAPDVDDPERIDD